MTRMLRGGMAVLTVLVAASTAAAQTDSARIAELVKKDQKIVIVDEDGRELKGRIQDLTQTQLGLATRNGTVDVPFDRIVKIDRPHDGLGNGALIGAAAFAGFATIAMASVQSSCSDTNESCRANPLVWAWVIGGNAAFGAGVGVAIDAMIHRDPKIYSRGSGVRTTIRPAVGGGVKGASVSVTW